MNCRAWGNSSQNKKFRYYSLPPVHYFGINVCAENDIFKYFREKSDMQHKSCEDAVSLRFRGACEVALYMCILSIIKKKKVKKATQTLKLYSFNSTVNCASYPKPCIPGTGMGHLVTYKRN